MNLLAIIADLRFQDVLDILFLAVVTYHLYLWFRGTKAFKALVGLLVLGVVYTLARSWGLFLTTWVFQVFWQVLVILLIILFQSEIRQVLERVNPLKKIGFHRKRERESWIEALSGAAWALAERGIGALIIVERLDRVDEWITGGLELEGQPTPEFLTSVFHKDSPLHDGAALIRDGHVVRVAGFLPLTSAEGLPKAWGTRHRAALGLSERCDALVIAVSEERGEVSLARGNRMDPVENRENLRGALALAMGPTTPPEESPWETFRSFFTRNWKVKLGTLTLVCLLWILLAGQQDFEVSLGVPLEVRGVPKGMEIVDPLNPEVNIRVRGLRKDASTLDERNILAEVDVSSAAKGRRVFPITREHISLPNDRVYIVKIEPSQITFTFRETPGFKSRSP